MWELAIQSSGTDRLQAGGIFEEGRTHAHSHHQHHHHHTHMDGVWSAEEVALVVQAVAGVMRVVPKERRVGQAATGGCWWWGCVCSGGRLATGVRLGSGCRVARRVVRAVGVMLRVV